MKTYTIGEALERFNSVKDMAFHFKGEMKGTIIFVDHTDDNRLTSIYPDGTETQALYIKLGENENPHDVSNIVFLNEITERDLSDINNVMIVIEAQDAIANIMKKFKEAMNELTAEEQEEISRKLSEDVRELQKIKEIKFQ